MNTVQKLGLWFKVFGYACFASALFTSFLIWSAGHQVDSQNTGTISSVVAILNFVISSIICSIFIYAGKLISEQRRFSFCKGVSIFTCLFVPIGTALGAYSLSVLSHQENAFERDKEDEPNPIG